ncbi:hypothetical protein NDU88_001640, partial [Pleurodeles waltl]
VCHLPGELMYHAYYLSRYPVEQGLEQPQSRGGTCNRVIASPVTALTPEPHRQCPGGTTQSSDYQKVSINPDIRVDSSSLTGQKGNTEEVRAHDSRKPEEAWSENRIEESHVDEDARRDDRSEESHTDERGEEGKKEMGGERLQLLRPLDERTCTSLEGHGCP